LEVAAAVVPVPVVEAVPVPVVAVLAPVVAVPELVVEAVPVPVVAVLVPVVELVLEQHSLAEQPNQPSEPELATVPHSVLVASFLHPPTNR
jgi:hypothetical protein